MLVQVTPGENMIVPVM